MPSGSWMRLHRRRQRESKKHQCYEQGKLVFNKSGTMPLAQASDGMKKTGLGGGRALILSFCPLSASCCGHNVTSCSTAPDSMTVSFQTMSQNNSLWPLHTHTCTYARRHPDYKDTFRETYTGTDTLSPRGPLFLEAMKSWPPSLTGSVGGVLGRESVTDCVGGKLNHISCSDFPCLSPLWLS